MHEGLELVAAIFVVSEHVETCEARTQQNVLAGRGEFRRTTNGLGKRRATRVGSTKGREMKRQLRTGFADQHDVLHPWGDPMGETGEIAALGFAAGNEDNGGIEAREGRLDRVKIRRLRVVPKRDALTFHHAREPVASE